MKSRKKICIIASVGVIVVLSALFYCIGSHHASEGYENTTDIIKNLSTTEEEKSILEQKYVTDKIEETLSGYEFESNEEKDHYRELLLEQFQD